MSISNDAGQGALERFSRRGLWMALVIVLLLGGFACLALAAPPGAWSRAADWVARLLPVFIVVAVASLRRTPASRAALAGLQHDELRRQSVALAMRDALVAVLVAQPVGAFVLTQAGLASPVALMACATATLGVVVLLAGILVRDR